MSAEKFVIYKDGVKDGSPKENVQAGQLSETAPDLTGDNLYFDHAEVNGKRVYEAGTLTEQDITYYGSISGALSILGESETIANSRLFMVSSSLHRPGFGTQPRSAKIGVFPMELQFPP